MGDFIKGVMCIAIPSAVRCNIGDHTVLLCEHTPSKVIGPHGSLGGQPARALYLRRLPAQQWLLRHQHDSPNEYNNDNSSDSSSSSSGGGGSSSSSGGGSSSTRRTQEKKVKTPPNDEDNESKVHSEPRNQLPK